MRGIPHRLLAKVGSNPERSVKNEGTTCFAALDLGFGLA